MADLMNETPDISTSTHELKDIYREVSTARKALKDSYQNLQNVADYCEKNYMEAPDKHKALESTMSLVTQTLASVACQVGVAARHMSDMLEVQSLMLQKEEAKVRYVYQLLDIHVEKVARQKIGKLATAKKYPHSEKIQYAQNRPLASYTRIPINFTSLDDTGHGTTDSDSQLSKTGTMSRKISVKHLGPTHGSLGRGSRTREPITPPSIPTQKTPCPKSPDSISPSFPTRMNGNFPLPPPEYLTPSTLQTELSLETGSNFSDLPPPPEPEENVSSWLPAPIRDGLSSSKSLESIDESFPPPPIDYEDKYSLCSIGNGLPSLVGTQSADDLPPPPAADYEIWPSENDDIMDCSASLDDLPPPPSDF